jgi:hypothetical protein
MNHGTLNQLVNTFHKITDPRNARGVRHDFHGMLLLIFLGLLAQLPCIATTYRWAKKYWHILRAPLGFKKMKPPVETTISRALAGCSLAELQNAFTEFLQTILAEVDEPVVAAIDGKSSHQFFDADDHPILMLNVFVHDLKLTLNQRSVRGDKTNEPGCLRLHLESLFEKYPMLELLTGDAIFAQRPLLEALKQHGRKYLFQLKENQGDAFEAVKYAFSEVGEPEDVNVSKKKAALKFANSGATSTTPGICATS